MTVDDDVSTGRSEAGGESCGGLLKVQCWEQRTYQRHCIQVQQWQSHMLPLCTAARPAHMSAPPPHVSCNQAVHTEARHAATHKPTKPQGVHTVKRIWGHVAVHLGCWAHTILLDALLLHAPRCCSSRPMRVPTCLLAVAPLSLRPSSQIPRAAVQLPLPPWLMPAQPVLLPAAELPPLLLCLPCRALYSSPAPDP